MIAKKFVGYITALIICFSCTSAARCQDEDSMSVIMAKYSLAKNPDLLFVHTDKHIYSNNEFIWFSAYLLRLGRDPASLHRFMSVSLVQMDIKKPVLHQKFQLTGGWGFGSIQLPDSIAPGEYKLMVYTNLVDSDSLPLALFTQELSVRSLSQPDFVSSMNISEDTSGKKEIVVYVRDKVTNKPVADADVMFWAGQKTLTGKTRKDGSFHTIDTGLTNTAEGPRIISAKIKYRGDVQYLQKEIAKKEQTDTLNIRFYPEGGNLLANAICRIGWESRTAKGEPISVKAVLFKNRIPVDTISTDVLGLGVFFIFCDASAQYSARVITLPENVRSKEEIYKLPAVLQKGLSLRVAKGIAGDSLSIVVYAEGYSMAKLVVHNFTTVFVAENIYVKPGGRPVLLLLDQIPKGPIAVTLLDSMNRPFAERIVFAHYDNKSTVTIQPDKKVYEKRQKVVLNFQLKNRDSACAGYASVSCAQANRFEDRKQQDIESFVFLQSQLQELPPYVKGRLYADTNYLENVLLVRGWRKYKWQEMMAQTVKTDSFFAPQIKGRAIGYFNKIKKPVSITLVGGDVIGMGITSDANGNFELRYSDLLIEQDRKIWIAAGKQPTENYIEITDPFTSINKKIAAVTNSNAADASRFLRYSQDLAESKFDRIGQLARVTVTAKLNSDQSIYRFANSCGDYVCSYNILNCPNHGATPGNRLPEKGAVYSSAGGGKVTYWGCVLDDKDRTAVAQYDGIKIGKEFYAENFSEKATGNPEFISTLFWSPLLVFDKDGKAECTFYTSDITGRFRIVVNGITENDMFFASGVFDVK
jgi:hypothetical protein